MDVSHSHKESIDLRTVERLNKKEVPKALHGQ
jgi:hypothetical protein